MSPKDLAAQVLKKYWDGKLPVRPEVIARQMGAEVKSAGFDLIGVSGMYSLVNNVPTIRYNPTEPLVRKRFTIAHELGHYCLGHEGVFRDTSNNFSSSVFDPKETAANKFAASLLMPSYAVKTLVEGGLTDIDELANRFAVSSVAMKYRLKNLGYIA